MCKSMTSWEPWKYEAKASPIASVAWAHLSLGFEKDPACSASKAILAAYRALQYPAACVTALTAS